MPLVVIFKEGEMLAVALPHGRIEGRGDRPAVAFDKSNAEPFGQPFRDTRESTLVKSDDNLKGHTVRNGLAPDRGDCLLQKKPARLPRIRERLQERRQYDGNRCQSRLPGYPDGPDKQVLPHVIERAREQQPAATGHQMAECAPHLFDGWSQCRMAASLQFMVNDAKLPQ